LHLAVEVFIINCAITNVVAADGNINDKSVGVIKSKAQNITLPGYLLLVAAVINTLWLTRTKEPVLWVSCARTSMTF